LELSESSLPHVPAQLEALTDTTYLCVRSLLKTLKGSGMNSAIVAALATAATVILSIGSSTPPSSNPASSTATAPVDSECQFLRDHASDLEGKAYASDLVGSGGPSTAMSHDMNAMGHDVDATVAARQRVMQDCEAQRGRDWCVQCLDTR